MLGVLGGGWLTRQFVVAARRMGYRVTVLDPDPDDGAGREADVHLVAEFSDEDALGSLASTCALVTTCGARATGSALAALAARVTVRPSATAVATCADRTSLTSFLLDIGAPTVSEDLRADTVERSLSMVVARSADGSTACYPVAEIQHDDGRTDVVFVPASLGRGGQQAAERLCTAVVDRLGVVGVATIDMVQVGTRVLVASIETFPGDRGLWSLDACQTDQFEQHLRAICGLGLGDPHLTVPAAATAMLRGAIWMAAVPRWDRVLRYDTAHLHLDASTAPTSDRELGHLTVTSGTPQVATNLARRLRSNALAR